MRPLEELGFIPTRPSEFRRPTENDFNNFEIRHRKTLPPEYRQLLFYCNGGGLIARQFPLKIGGVVEEWPINRFYFIGPPEDDPCSLEYHMHLFAPILKEGFVPIADNGFGDPIILDVSTSPASVKVISHEDNGQVFEVAESFEQFLDMLRPFDESPSS